MFVSHWVILSTCEDAPTITTRAPLRQYFLAEACQRTDRLSFGIVHREGVRQQEAVPTLGFAAGLSAKGTAGPKAQGAKQSVRFQHSEESFLRNLHLADLFHAFFAGCLLGP